MFSIPVNSDTAKNIATIWLSHKMNTTKTVFEIKTISSHDTVFMYVFNFSKGGFVITAADTKVIPIIAYSDIGYFDVNNMAKATSDWMQSYLETFRYIINSNHATPNANAAWKTVNSSTAMVKSETQPTSVPSLFETQQTSKWSYWYPYSMYFPGEEGDDACVPIAISQICKYWRFPKQGISSNSYSVENRCNNIDTFGYFSVNFANQLYDYSQMPFMLTYGEDSGWKAVPGITLLNQQAISHLMYDCGVAVGSYWWCQGTQGPSYNWAAYMDWYLNYNGNFNYWDTAMIDHNHSVFKDSLRNDLINSNPSLFSLVGHAVVCDGYQDNNYFHFAWGDGNDSPDGYYYLFPEDTDGIHQPKPGSALLDATLKITPNCTRPNTQLITVNQNTTSVKCYSAKTTITASCTIDGNGSSGAAIMFEAGTEIILNRGFTVQQGASFIGLIDICK